jgi:hypothetical protein
MSPAEAVYISLSLIHQKLYNPKYQVTSHEWAQARAAENWQRWNSARSGKGQSSPSHPSLVAGTTSPRTAEINNVVSIAVTHLDSNTAMKRLTKGLDDLGVPR